MPDGLASGEVHAARWRSATARVWDSDLAYSFRHSPLAVASAVATALILCCAAFAPWIAPHDPYDLATVSVLDARNPPAWITGGSWSYPLGTDNLGRDMLSAMLYGSRLSLAVGFCSMLFAAVLGIALGLVAGYFGGIVDAVLMRIAEVQLSFPAILVALLIDGVARGVVRPDMQDRVAPYVLILSIGLSYWVHFARTVRGSTLVERNKDYVLAARVIGRAPLAIMLRHVLPNVLGPVLVIATITLAVAIITEATLSFLGVGVPPTMPSLGTLIRVGNEFLFSGEWWITIFPGLLLVVLVLAVNILGDWLRDALNPKLR
ncbi:MAG: ABC transporter permease [Pseudomonadota bacterium]|nr:ABC transporter permease [Pseudomonadota bacterium]